MNSLFSLNCEDGEGEWQASDVDGELDDADAKLEFNGILPAGGLE